MDKSNMSELRFEAPLATFDMDEWNEFVDDQPASPCSAVSRMSEASSSVSSSPQNNKNNNSYATELDIGDNNSEDFENENLSGSLEDLVNTFDAKIIKCFKNYNEHSEIIAPIQIRSEDDILADNQ
ncbi:hypothetical protein HELRODRAFT_178324 [Helobdella robusta]|uniref:Uncharacterized protein n=1 Tax=Helobdella robusta TaxID=6412 RepID=T1FD28_HELRO|nr:hypothetical protein HELRODRAFT_178324 [Helobdella robusta]ESN97205.1 hypothetical protein HELRODRAFT_178324 [Helobdella robusta]